MSVQCIENVELYGFTNKSLGVVLEKMPYNEWNMKEAECQEGKSFPSFWYFIIYPSSMTNTFFVNLINFFKYVSVSNCLDGLQFIWNAIECLGS